MVPTWIKLIAASRDELLSEILLTIEDLGGVEAAEKALRQLGSETKSNWVLDERFVTSATKDKGKTLQEILDEMHKTERGRTPEEKKPEVEPFKEPTPKPESKEPREPQKIDREKLSQSQYLALLLGLFVGVGGALTADQLKKIHLQKLMDEAKVGPPLEQRPLPVPTEEPEEISPEEYDEREAEFQSQMKMRKDEIAGETNPEKKKELERDLKNFEIHHKFNQPDVFPEKTEVKEAPKQTPKEEKKEIPKEDAEKAFIEQQIKNTKNEHAKKLYEQQLRELEVRRHLEGK